MPAPNSWISIPRELYILRFILISPNSNFFPPSQLLSEMKNKIPAGWLAGVYLKGGSLCYIIIPSFAEDE
jgi:hypothetical protein